MEKSGSPFSQIVRFAGRGSSHYIESLSAYPKSVMTTVFQIIFAISDLEQDLINRQQCNIIVFRVINMKKSQIKNAFLHFITAVITSSILGYLSHDLMNGVRIGLGVGTGIAIVDVLNKSN